MLTETRQRHQLVVLAGGSLLARWGPALWSFAEQRGEVWKALLQAVAAAALLDLAWLSRYLLPLLIPSTHAI